MAARADHATLPLTPRWLVLPPLVRSFWLGLTTKVLRLKQRAQEPSLPRMSDEWLQSHQNDNDSDIE
jgi:hypothetical protein